MTNTSHHLTYVPALDGIRAFSILLVFIGHQGFAKVIPGGLGVTIFFFISGFLITTLLLSEYGKTNTISLKNFYIRRLLRLYPALLFMLFGYTIYLLLAQKQIVVSEFFAALFYFENYHKLYINPAADHFWILWSLAVEEHFYLAFPFLFLCLKERPKWMIAATVGLILLSLLFRFLTAINFDTNVAALSTSYLTHNRFDSILIGCLASMVLHSSERDRLLRFASNYFVYGIALLLLVTTVVYREPFFRQTFRYSLQGVSLFLLVPPVIYSTRYSSLRKTLSLKPLVFIGKLSYSIYLFHWVAVGVFTDLGFKEATLPWIAGNILLTLSLSLISYYGVEMPFTGLRSRFRSGSQQVSGSERTANVMLLAKEESKILRGDE